MRKKVHLSEELAPSAYNRLKEKFEIVTDFEHPEELDAIITRKIKIDRNIISRAKKCKVICNHGTGTDQIDLAAAKEAGIAVESAPGLNARSVAELALGFIMALSFKMKFNDSGMQEGKFSKFGLPELQGNEVFGKKVGLIGSGNIARQLAAILKQSFNAKIYCWNNHRSKEELSQLGFEKVESLSELFKICDIISIHTPLTEETKNLINKDILKAANPDLILVNTARGGIINESDLYEALSTGKIKAAACDVFVQEPPAPATANPLLALPNFLGTLHVGGSTAEALDRVGNKCIDNLEKYFPD